MVFFSASWIWSHSLRKHGQGGPSFIGEALINEMANINPAIVYSFTGEFARAMEILDTQWLLLY